MSVPKRRLIALCAALCAAAALWTAALRYTPAPEQQVVEPVQGLELPEEPAPEQPPMYELRSVDGELCIFRGKTLIRSTGVYTLALPKEDRELLENGIAAASEEALASLLEDLCS